MTTQQKENIWYIAVAIAVLLLMVSEHFGLSAIAFVPIVLVLKFVGYWTFDVS